MEQHTKNLLLWIESEVVSAGGDGDAIWISGYEKLEAIYPWLIALNKENWDNHWIIEKRDSDILCYNGQEYFVITEDINYRVPTWSQCTITW